MTNELRRRLSRRAVIRQLGLLGGAVALAPLLSSCGRGEPAVESPAPAPTQTRVASPTASAAGAATPTPASPTPTSTPAGERVVRHAMGQATVPAAPQRVVVLDMGELDIALALGVQPIGYATYTANEELAPYLQERMTESTWVGTVTEPDLELVLSLQPDLILTNKLRHEAIYQQLSQIAPTVCSETVGVVWKENLQLFAEALGKAEEGERLMADYFARLEEFKRAMGPRLDETEVSLVRSFPDHVRIYMKASFMGSVVEDAGLPRPPAQDKDIFMEEATAERIRDLDGDVMFIMYWNRQQGEQLSQLMQHPLWSRLDVVQQGRVYEVDDRIWGTGLGPLAANRIIDDLFKYLVEEWA